MRRRDFVNTKPGLCGCHRGPVNAAGVDCDQCTRELAALAQPVLAGAEHVRETETPTPEFDAPYGLTPAVGRTSAPRQTRLFEED